MMRPLYPKGIIMPENKTHTEKAQIALVLTDSTRHLLQLMNFHEIPAEATHVAFLEDGNAVFLEGVETRPGSFSFPRFAMVTYITDIEVEIDDE